MAATHDGLSSLRPPHTPTTRDPGEGRFDLKCIASSTSRDRPIRSSILPPPPPLLLV